MLDVHSRKELKIFRNRLEDPRLFGVAHDPYHCDVAKCVDNYRDPDQRELAGPSDVDAANPENSRYGDREC